MLTSTTSAIQAAGKNNLALIAFLVNALIGGVSALVKKEKKGTRIAFAFSLICVIGLIVIRLLPKDLPASPSVTTGDVMVHGNDNGTAIGNGNEVNVHSKKRNSSDHGGGK